MCFSSVRKCSTKEHSTAHTSHVSYVSYICVRRTTEPSTQHHMSAFQRESDHVRRALSSAYKHKLGFSRVYCVCVCERYTTIAMFKFS